MRIVSIKWLNGQTRKKRAKEEDLICPYIQFLASKNPKTMAAMSREIDRVRLALEKTHSPFFVPLIICAVAGAGVEAALQFVVDTPACVPRDVDRDALCDWAEALAAAVGWTAASVGGMAKAERVYHRMTHDWGTPRRPYMPGNLQEALVDLLFKHDAPAGEAMTSAAVAHALE